MPDTDGPLGVLIYSLIAVVIVALLRTLRGPIFTIGRKILLHAPDRARRKLTTLAYLIAPRWRSYSPGSPRTAGQLSLRLGALKTSSRKFPISLVGGIYQDLIVRPVDLTASLDVEKSNLDRVIFQPGGSVFYTAHHLWKGFRLTAHVFTTIGKNGYSSKALKRALFYETGVRKAHFVSIDGMDTGLSIHLLAKDNKRLPTLTYRGAVGHLRWPDILKGLQRTYRSGSGVLYISSIFRTELCRGLDEAIRQLPPRVLVILDLGRTDENMDPVHNSDILRAFKEGIVDILICSIGELRKFGISQGIPPTSLTSDKNVVTCCELQKILPAITIVRGQESKGFPKAVLIYDGKASLVDGDNRRWVPKQSVGGFNAFNAGFLNALHRQNDDLSIRDGLKSAVRFALNYWSTTD